MGLWYTKDSGFELTGFLDADYAGCKDTFKSTSGGTQFLGKKLYVVPTGRVVVPTGRYVVLAGKVIIIVSTGSNNDIDDASAHSEATIPQQQQNIQPQIITTVSNNNAKFPYLKKEEYERESKARTTLLLSIPDDHVVDFHYIDDARDIWNAVKARISKAEGLHKGYDKMQKILSQLNQLKAKPEDEDINLKFLRALPSSWSQVALTLKTKGGLELLSFDDLYYKLKTFKVDIKGYSTFSSSQSAGPSHSAFVSTTSASKKMSYADSPSYSSSTYTAPSNSKTGSHRSGNVIEDVLQSFVADTKEASTAGDAGEFALMGVTSEVHNCPFGCDNKYNELQKQHNELNEQNSEYFIQVQAYKNSLKTLEKQKRVLQKNQLTLEDKIRVLSIELENTTNLLKHSERINAIVETAKKELQKKLDNYLRFNSNDFASSDSSVKSSEPKSNDSTFCASTSSIFTSESEAEIESKKQMANKTVGNGVGPVHSRNNVNHQNQFVPQVVLLRTGKVNIPPASPQPVPTGKPNVPAPVPTGRQNRPFPVPTDR
ncbi:hypothetical protein Tco_1086259 [Tanacetum coccineum]